MEFTCRRCEFTTTFKQSLHRHLRNKNPCPTTNEDISRETLLDQLRSRESNKNSYECLYCNRKFCHQSSQSRHMSKCPSKPTITDDLVKRVVFLEEQQLKNKGSQDIQNQLNNHGTIIINNINLKNFGEENQLAIPLDLIRSCFLNLEFNTMFENLHCDPDYPENHNVRIKSFKRELLEIYKNDKWNSLCFSDGFREVIQQIYIIFKEYTRHHVDLLSEDMNDEEIEENERKLDRIFEWIKDTQSKLRQIKEVKQITAVLDTQR